MRIIARSTLLILFALFILPLLAVAQSSGDPQPPEPQSTQQQPPRSRRTIDPQFGQQRQQTEDEVRLEKEQAKRANLDRQASLKRDTDRLLQLATELKQAVDKSNENTLSLSVVKKAEEIEKLAKSVRLKMKAE